MRCLDVFRKGTEPTQFADKNTPAATGQFYNVDQGGEDTTKKKATPTRYRTRRVRNPRVPCSDAEDTYR